MTVEELMRAADWKALCLPDPERVVCGAYCGDLLSWVMGRAKSGNVWITIMSNMNTVAVASLADVSCIVLAEGVEPDADMLETAKKQGVNLLSSEQDAFCVAVTVGKLL